jgi:hypothetical protein
MWEGVTMWIFNMDFQYGFSIIMSKVDISLWMQFPDCAVILLPACPWQIVDLDLVLCRFFLLLYFLGLQVFSHMSHTPKVTQTHLRCMCVTHLRCDKTYAVQTVQAVLTFALCRCYMVYLWRCCILGWEYNSNLARASEIKLLDGFKARLWAPS